MTLDLSKAYLPPIFPFDYSLFPYITPVNGGVVRPIRPGCSISGPLKKNKDGMNVDYVGTIAGFFRDEDGDVVALSTISCFGDPNNCQPGDLIYQPGLYDNKNYGPYKDTAFKGWPDVGQADAAEYPYFATLKRFVLLTRQANPVPFGTRDFRMNELTNNEPISRNAWSGCLCGLATAKVHPSFLSNNLIDPTYKKPIGDLSVNLTIATKQVSLGVGPEVNIGKGVYDYASYVTTTEIDYIKEDSFIANLNQYPGNPRGYFNDKMPIKVQKFGRTTGYTTGYYYYDLDNGDIDYAIQMDPNSVGTNKHETAKIFRMQRFTNTTNGVVWPQSPQSPQDINGTGARKSTVYIMKNKVGPFTPIDMSIVGWKIYASYYVDYRNAEGQGDKKYLDPVHVATVREDGTWSYIYGFFNTNVFAFYYTNSRHRAIHPTLGNINTPLSPPSTYEKLLSSDAVDLVPHTDPTVKPFALPGDAGGMVFDMQMRPISIIMAGIPSVIPPNKPSQYLIDQFDYDNYFAKRNPKATYIQAGKGPVSRDSQETLVDRYAEVETITAGDHSDLNIITLGVSVERAIKIFKLKPFTL